MPTLDAPKLGVLRPKLLNEAMSGATRYECEQNDGVCPVTELREALAREAALLVEREILLDRQATLCRESDHRLLNNLQMVSSLLSMQSRSSLSVESASALALAADRVAMIGRIHRHLHSNDGVESVAFVGFVSALCRDFTTMLSSQGSVSRPISVRGPELLLPSAVAIPLGFVASELITNALKYGEGPITVHVAKDPRKGCALSVENAGPALAHDFDPAASKGFGMRIIRSLVAAIGGELCVARGRDDQGARFTVLFAAPEQAR
jgi:two-component sensor histidine kinase